MENQETEQEEADYFTRFMFGEKRAKGEEDRTKANKNHDGEVSDVVSVQDEDEAPFNRRNRLFGYHERSEPDEQRKPIDLFSIGRVNEKKQSTESFIYLVQNIDYAKLMEHFDTLIAATNQLKPILKKIKPLLDTLKK